MNGWKARRMNLQIDWALMGAYMAQIGITDTASFVRDDFKTWPTLKFSWQEEADISDC